MDTTTQSTASDGNCRAISSVSTEAVSASAPLPPNRSGTQSPSPAKLGESRPEIARNAALAVQLADARFGQLAREELPHRAAQDLVLAGRIEVHALSASSSPR